VYVNVYDNLDRLTVVEAAKRLGVKEQAVRKRIARGTLHHTKDEDGRVYVHLVPSDTNAKPEAEGNGAGDGTGTYALIRSLEDQVGYLRREVEDWKDESRRKDAILMSLTQRIPELEAPGEPRDAPDTGPGHADAPEGGVRPRPAATGGAQKGSEPRSWWRRFFGF
jgi:excisionase family DNA binding protein